MAQQMQEMRFQREAESKRREEREIERAADRRADAAERRHDARRREDENRRRDDNMQQLFLMMVRGQQPTTNSTLPPTVLNPYHEASPRGSEQDDNVSLNSEKTPPKMHCSSPRH